MEESKDNREEEEYCLSDSDIRRVAGRTGLLILRYPELAKFATWKDFMKNRAHAAAVLFLVQSERSGHWLAAFDGPQNTAYVWDPLGMPLDGQRAVISPEARSALGEERGEFARLLATAQTAGKKVCVNHTEFQEFSPSVNTCGRWVAMRLLHRNKNDAEFKALVMDGVRRMGAESPDAWITLVTNPKLEGGGLACFDEDPTSVGGAMQLERVAQTDPSFLQNYIECEIDRVGTGGAFASSVLHQLVREASGLEEADGLRQWPASQVLQEAQQSWQTARGGCLSGAAFWRGLRGASTYISNRVAALKSGRGVEPFVSAL